MKKLLIVLLSLTMLWGMSVQVFASTESSYGTLTLPEDDGSDYPVTGIGDQYCMNNDEIYKLVVPDNIQRIGEEAFLGCLNLKEIEMGDGVQFIGADAFKGTAYYNDPNNWVDGVLYIDDCLIKADPEAMGDTYAIRPGTRLIATGAFADCERLASIQIPDSVEYVGADAFAGTALLEEAGNRENGLLYVDNILLAADNEYAFGTLEIKEGTTTVADYAFSNCHELTSLVCPESLRFIGYNAFWDCQKLERVVLGSNVEALGRGSFRMCDELKEIVVPESNEYFAVVDGVLYNKELTIAVRCPQQREGRVVLPNTVKHISAYAFEWCAALEEVVIPEGCVFIGNSAFSVCEILDDVVLPESMEYIDEYAFSYCNGLKSVSVPKNVTYLGSYAFTCCMNLYEAKLGLGISTIRPGVFESCKRLNSVELGPYVTDISSDAFLNSNYSLNVDNYQNGMLIASDRYLIKVAPSVEECRIPDGVALIADGAFDFSTESNSLGKIIVPDSIKAFSWDVFSDVGRDVKVYYDGTLSDFIHITDFDWDCIDLYTTNHFGGILSIGGMLILMSGTVIGMVMYEKGKRKRICNLDDEEGDYDEDDE